jgi:hypothetical protein
MFTIRQEIVTKCFLEKKNYIRREQKEVLCRAVKHKNQGDSLCLVMPWLLATSQRTKGRKKEIWVVAVACLGARAGVESLVMPVMMQNA